MDVSWIWILLCGVRRIWRFSLFVATILRVPPVNSMKSRVSYPSFDGSPDIADEDNLGSRLAPEKAVEESAFDQSKGSGRFIKYQASSR
jgi:hypothetical protein